MVHLASVEFIVGLRKLCDERGLLLSTPALQNARMLDRMEDAARIKVTLEDAERVFRGEPGKIVCMLPFSMVQIWTIHHPPGTHLYNLR